MPTTMSTTMSATVAFAMAAMSSAVAGTVTAFMSPVAAVTSIIGFDEVYFRAGILFRDHFRGVESFDREELLKRHFVRRIFEAALHDRHECIDVTYGCLRF